MRCNRFGVARADMDAGDTESSRQRNSERMFWLDEFAIDND